MKEPRLVLGRNYVETLILTHEQYILEAPTLEILEYITMREEELLCSIAMVQQYIMNSYHDKIHQMIQQQHPEIPYSNPNTCFTYRHLLDWMKRNKDRILGSRKDIITPQTIEEELKRMAMRIVRTAVLSTLMESGIIRIK